MKRCVKLSVVVKYLDCDYCCCYCSMYYIGCSLTSKSCFFDLRFLIIIMINVIIIIFIIIIIIIDIIFVIVVVIVIIVGLI